MGRAPQKKSRKQRIQEVNSRMAIAPNNGGEDFKNAVAAYQNSLQADNGSLPTSSNIGEKRKGGGMNNVWGSILREDVLTSDLTSISVCMKSVKDLHSDRGAEVSIIILINLLYIVKLKKTFCTIKYCGQTNVYCNLTGLRLLCGRRISCSSQTR